jgi:hypothetical protein
VVKGHRGQRRKVLSAYIRERLRIECAVRGTASKIATATGFSTAHLANVQKEERGVGDDFAEAMAIYWGFTPEALRVEAERWAKEHPEKVGGDVLALPSPGSPPADPCPERTAGAKLALAAGVDEWAVAAVLAEEVPPEREGWKALFWANRMQMVALRELPGAQETTSAPQRSPGARRLAETKVKKNRRPA